ncbi:MAG TPA: hypothetical protein VFT74_12075 [Isosphaeraceae bacterium]|nr:hypothetical protein [Isosphaeraceae bacterium]
MVRMDPGARLLGLPAWFWVLLPIPLLSVGLVMPWMWPPGPLSEPIDSSKLFADPVLVTPANGSYAFVPFDRHQGVKPLWAINLATAAKQDRRWRSVGVVPGLVHRSASWKYELSGIRFDKGWQDEVGVSALLSSEVVRQLRPRVVEELNRRAPVEKSGDLLEDLLNRGQRRATYVCAQNAEVVLAWVSLPMALVAFGSMFLAPRVGVSKPPSEAVPLA